MSYARLFSPGFSGLPSGLSLTDSAKMTFAAYQANKPEADLAARAFMAGISGNGAAFRSSVQDAASRVAALGVGAACAATGAGAVIAPVCGYVGNVLAKNITAAIFGGGGPSCVQRLESTKASALAQLEPQCRGDAQCLRDLAPVVQAYGERSQGSCAITDKWSMANIVYEESRNLDKLCQAQGMAPGACSPFQGGSKGDNSIFMFGSGPDSASAWQGYAKRKLAADVAPVLLAAKMRRWEAEAAAARKVADQVYDELVPTCSQTIGRRPPPIRVPGTVSPCAKKAADAAMIIASRQYAATVIDGAPQISAMEITALKSQFRAEIAQDRAIAATSAAQVETGRTQASLTQTVSAVQAQTEKQRKLLFLGAVTLVAMGGLAYAHSKRKR